MNNSIKIVASLCVGLILSMASCKQNTEPKSVRLIHPDVEKQDPELYQSYLQNLRSYKANQHKPVVVWFDNSNKIPASQAHQLVAIPDSVDMVALMYPDGLTDVELAQMKTIREQKATRTIYSVDYDKIESAYMLKAETAAAGSLKPFAEYLIDTLVSSLKICSDYAYDGICVEYDGKSTLHMTAPEKSVYEQNQNVFFGIISGWAKRNPSKVLIFRGQPQNIVDAKLYDLFSLLLIKGEKATNRDAFSYFLSLSNTEAVPTDKLGMTVECTALNDPNKLQGYLSDGSLKVAAFADWVGATHLGVSLQGAGLYNASTDYYNIADNYHYTRRVIQALNPSIK